MSRTLNQRQRVTYVNGQWKKLVASYKSGRSVYKIALAWHVSTTTILNILHRHDCPMRQAGKAEMASKKEVEARIAFCRRPDLIAWQCGQCGEIYSGQIMPFACGCCHASQFTRISIPQPLDIQRLDILDKIPPTPPSRLAQKRQLSPDTTDPQGHDAYKRRLASVIDLRRIQSRGLRI